MHFCIQKHTFSSSFFVIISLNRDISELCLVDAGGEGVLGGVSRTWTVGCRLNVTSFLGGVQTGVLVPLDGMGLCGADFSSSQSSIIRVRSWSSSGTRSSTVISFSPSLGSLVKNYVIQKLKYISLNGLLVLFGKIVIMLILMSICYIGSYM